MAEQERDQMRRSSSGEKDEGNGSESHPRVGAFLKYFTLEMVFYFWLPIIVFGGYGLYNTKWAYAGNAHEYGTSWQQGSAIMFRQYTWYPSWSSTDEMGTFHKSSDNGNNRQLNILSMSNIPRRGFLSSQFSANGSPTQHYYKQCFEFVEKCNNTLTGMLFRGMYHLPEWLTMVLFAFGGLFLYGGLFFVNVAFCILGSVQHIRTLFEKTETLDPTSWIWPMFLACVQLFGFMWILMPAITTGNSILAPLFQSYYYDGEDPLKIHHGFPRYLWDLIQKKRGGILGWMSFRLIMNAWSYLGGYYALGALGAVLGLASLGIFTRSIIFTKLFPPSQKNSPDLFSKPGNHSKNNNQKLTVNQEHDDAAVFGGGHRKRKTSPKSLGGNLFFLPRTYKK